MYNIYLSQQPTCLLDSMQTMVWCQWEHKSYFIAKVQERFCLQESELGLLHCLSGAHQRSSVSV